MNTINSQQLEPISIIWGELCFRQQDKHEEINSILRCAIFLMSSVWARLSLKHRKGYCVKLVNLFWHLVYRIIYSALGWEVGLKTSY